MRRRKTYRKAIEALDLKMRGVFAVHVVGELPPPVDVTVVWRPRRPLRLVPKTVASNVGEV
jgi:hypothetical protein